jgi:phosphatidylserine/phosphatidylglycerophosphate/cardiolipin synthase-like enzyme
VTITTEDPEDKTHAVYFNRGVAGSQAYSRRFGKYRKWYKVEQQGRIEAREFVKPEDVPDREAYKWLSRGLEEAMLAFIGQAAGPEYKLRAAVYEFTYIPVIQAFVDALERGVDVKIIHHAKRENLLRLKRNSKNQVTMTFKDGSQDPVLYKNREVKEEQLKDSICMAADEAVSRIGLINRDFLDDFDRMMIERTITQISHNKFIVLLKNDKPIQVWTGSTNFTAGGIFGQSNVGHVVRDEKVAQKYYEYWQKLSTDPEKKSRKSDPPDAGIRDWTILHQPDLQGPPPENSITAVFSPRLTKAMLDWYADRLEAAENSVFFTAAFSVADEIFKKVKKKKKISSGEPYLRYLLLEGITGLMRKKYPDMAKCPQNRIAWGDTLRRRQDEEEHKQFIETLTGLNDHVNYLHTKYMLIDPLSDDPVVITGSANFSEASTTKNDENMLIIRGNTRVADIFLGEFMRLFNHFHSRNQLNKLSDEEARGAEYLSPDDSWATPYYTKGTQEYWERLLFS